MTGGRYSKPTDDERLGLTKDSHESQFKTLFKNELKTRTKGTRLKPTGKHMNGCPIQTALELCKSKHTVSTSHCFRKGQNAVAWPS